jgi:POT family proton-dependent oligopeptide transporter
LALVYFMPMVGGWIADRWNFQKTVTLGIFVMFAGYLVMSLPTGRGLTSSLAIMMVGMFLIASGTGLFKGNLQVMVGDLYNDPRYSDKRDVAFSIFYMAINIGAVFAPTTSEKLCTWALSSKGFTYDPNIPSLCNQLLAGETLKGDELAQLQAFAGNTTNLTEFAGRYMDAISNGYTLAFAVAALSMVLSYLIYRLGRSTYAGVSDNKTKDTKAAEVHHAELTPEQTKSRITALLLVFAVVIFFWMVFQQSGATLTKYAEVFTQNQGGGWTRIGFNVWALVCILVGIYSAMSFFQSKKAKGRVISGVVFLAAVGAISYFYATTPDPVTDIQPQIFQQFNPFYVVALTPLSVGIFSWLAKRKKEPSAPRKIGYGMIVAAFAFFMLSCCSIGLGIAPTAGQGANLVSPQVLMGTYLVLTFAELLLSPMGISFVSEVAPPKYKGAMMGCWFGATAIGNYLVFIPTLLWNKIDNAVLWCILGGVCLVAAGFIFAMMKRLEAVTAESVAQNAAE